VDDDDDVAVHNLDYYHHHVAAAAVAASSDSDCDSAEADAAVASSWSDQTRQSSPVVPHRNVPWIVSIGRLIRGMVRFVMRC